MVSQSAKMRSRIAKTELQILKKVCREIDTPRSLAVFLLATHHEYKQLLTLDINPHNYDSPSAFADDYLVTEMLKKSKAIDAGFDQLGNAYSKWLDAEKQCLETNDRIMSFLDGQVSPTNPKVLKILARARCLVHDILGPLTRRTLSKIEENFDFGPGVTTGCSGAITRGRKFSSRTLTTTQRLLSFGIFCLPHLWRSQVRGFDVQEYNELMFVDKNAKTKRPITKENDLNIFIQKGIGSVLKLKLANIGINTQYQWRVNRRLASEAHASDLCTIDLSSASDTLAYQVVAYFLPDDWFQLLDYCRPSQTKFGDTVFYLEKFSGMGNGYTFELETLIFHSVLLACKQLSGSCSPISTFGDDMICGTDIMKDVVDTLTFLGFSVNSEKTFGKGRFHESCGVDYFDGINVRPFFLRSDGFDEEEALTRYRYCNSLRRYACHRNGGYSCDSRFLPAWLDCFSGIPKNLRLFVPDFGYESVGIVGNLDEAAPATVRPDRRHGFSGFRFRGLVRKSITTARFAEGAYIGSLKKLTSWSKGVEPIRHKTKAAKQQEFYTLSWIELGPWI